MTEVLRPLDEADLAAMVRAATGPLRIRGGGTRGMAGAGVVLEVGGLSGITLYEPGALTLVVRAGTAVADVQAVLGAEGQRLAFEPPDFRALLGAAGTRSAGAGSAGAGSAGAGAAGMGSAGTGTAGKAVAGTGTVGGMVAANASGPRRVQAGACRDAMLGVRFVDGRGTVVKNGGRVMKNVTGYDLVKLMAGAWGTLGVVSEVAFKVLPVPETAASVVLQGLPDQAAVAAMALAMGSPFDVTGAAHIQGGATLLRIEGFAASVAYRAARLAGSLAAFGTVGIEDRAEVVAADWAAVRDVTAFAGVPGNVWRLSVRPSDAPGIGARLGAWFGAGRVIYDWAGGLIWAVLAENIDLRARLGPIGGHATLVRGNAPAGVSVFQPEPAAVAAIAAGLRAEFDPRGILNPGVMG